jgi:hypothetical protein
MVTCQPGTLKQAQIERACVSQAGTNLLSGDASVVAEKNEYGEKKCAPRCEKQNNKNKAHLGAGADPELDGLPESRGRVHLAVRHAQVERGQRARAPSSGSRRRLQGGSTGKV